MTPLDPQGKARPTRLSVDAVRADLLFRLAQTDAHRVRTLQDLRNLVPSWSDDMWHRAIDTNVARGTIDQDAFGRIVVQERRR